MNHYLIPIMLTAVFLFVGCSADTTPDTLPDVPDSAPDDAPDTGAPDGGPTDPGSTEPYATAYENGVLTYSVNVMTPTPCHRLSVNERILESDPVQIAIEINIIEPEPGRVCAQVISEQSVEGRITTSEPGRVTITTPNNEYEATP